MMLIIQHGSTPQKASKNASPALAQSGYPATASIARCVQRWTPPVEVDPMAPPVEVAARRWTAWRRPWR
ncbi:MAG: hypothetical protein JXB32_22070 [Deltaproteobacteria bacterium]|nr:hypothetical protein [Deltaproteobacteria bacterium]